MPATKLSDLTPVTNAQDTDKYLTVSGSDTVLTTRKEVLEGVLRIKSASHTFTQQAVTDEVLPLFTLPAGARVVNVSYIVTGGPIDGTQYYPDIGDTSVRDSLIVGATELYQFGLYINILNKPQNLSYPTGTSIRLTHTDNSISNPPFGDIVGCTVTVSVQYIVE